MIYNKVIIRTWFRILLDFRLQLERPDTVPVQVQSLSTASDGRKIDLISHPGGGRYGVEMAGVAYELAWVIPTLIESPRVVPVNRTW